MITKTYKSYTIQIVGLSHHIFRPGEYVKVAVKDDIHNRDFAHSVYAPGFAFSMAEAKRWINTDIQKDWLKRCQNG